MGPGEPLSEDRYQALLERVDDHLSVFAASEQFETLTSHQRAEAGFVIETAGELLAAYAGVPIDAPDRRSLEFVCTDIYPAKISADPPHFHAVAPVLGAFFRFLDAEGHLDDGTALAAHVEALGDEIVDTAADPANWGMAKSMVMGWEADEAITEELGAAPAFDYVPGRHEDPPGRSPDEIDPAAAPDALAEPDFGVGPTDSPYSLEEEAAIIEAFDAVSDESTAILEATADALLDPTFDGDPAALFESADVTLDELTAVFDEVLDEAGVDRPGLFGDAEAPRILDPEPAGRFFEWYGKLLVYVNDRFDIVPEIGSYEEFSRAYRDETYAIREHLFTGCDTAAVIDDFVVENPAGLSEAALEAVASWKHYRAGDFAVVERRDADVVFLDPATPRAFAVTGIEPDTFDGIVEERLPVTREDVVLLPFEDTIVPDPWMGYDPLILLGRRGIDGDIDAMYAEAKHRFGITVSLPAGGERDRTDAEDLRFYTKNRTNRERFAEEIDRLKNRSDELAWIYHEQLGKASARRLGREFRELGLEAAYVGIYDGRVVATAPTEAQLEEQLASIMPDGRADHPYVYHYDP